MASDGLFAADGPVYVAGHRGMVGSAVWRALESAGGVDLVGRASAELDLRDRGATFDYVADARPSTVVIAAAKVGGILGNSTYPVEFLTDNLQIELNLLDACHAADVERVLFLGSSCIYPKMAPQPISEDSLLTGPLEPTNEAYAIAKIAGVLHVQGYRRQYGHRWISAMPTNLYGPGDNYDLQTAHVLPAMIAQVPRRRRSAGGPVVLWGTGSPRREFLHVDDLAAAVLTLLETYDERRADQRGHRHGPHRSASSPRSWPRSSASRAASSGTRPSPTAPRGSCST